MAQNEKLAELSEAGVSIWLDDLSRDRIRTGNLQSLVDEYSVVGVTSNPTIFAAAISGSDSYDDQLHALAVREVSVEEALRTITASDVRDACDLLAPVAEMSPGDGRVSLEVAPGLAHETDATAAEAMRPSDVPTLSLLASTPEAPCGGVKLSGHGRELGPWGMHEFMNLKAVMYGAGKAGD